LYNVFPTLPQEGHDFRKKKIIEHKMCSIFLYNFACNISYSKNIWARYDRKRVFVAILDIFSKNTQISKFMKIRPVGAQFFHADGRTDLSQIFCESSYCLRKNISA